MSKAKYDEFRLVLSPDVQMVGMWKVDLAACPIKKLVGPKGIIRPVLTRMELTRLRSRHGWPNLADLQSIGTDVWKSILTPDAEAALKTCLELRRSKNLRIVVVLQGQEGSEYPPNTVRLAEIPVEALYNANYSFLATDLSTPVSRSFKITPDLKPFRVALPLHVLTVVATPNDQPDADAEEEVKALRTALDPLIKAHTLQLDFCNPATRQEFAHLLATKPYHIVHFIGHGGFDVEGDDPSPRAHLCFVRRDPGQLDRMITDPMDAYTLCDALRNTEVRLVVITACSSAAAVPDAEPYAASAFEGVAQRLFSASADVSAVIAMQFDLEASAAVAFTREFYSDLLKPGCTLDEAVTRARKQLVADLQAGHRAWVNPVVFWRCRSGLVFDIEPIDGLVDVATQEKLRVVDAQRTIYRRVLDDLHHEPAEIRKALTNLELQYEMELSDLERQRGELLGETVRLVGGRALPSEGFESRLTMRVRSPSKIDLVQVTVQYPTTKMAFVRATPGRDYAGPPPTTVERVAGQVQVVLPVPSGGQIWTPREYELALLQLNMLPDATPSIIELRIVEVEVRCDGQVVPFQSLDGVVFIEGKVVPSPRGSPSMQ